MTYPKQTRNLKDLSETNLKLKGRREVFGLMINYKLHDYIFFYGKLYDKNTL